MLELRAKKEQEIKTKERPQKRVEFIHRAIEEEEKPVIIPKIQRIRIRGQKTIKYPKIFGE